LDVLLWLVSKIRQSICTNFLKEENMFTIQYVKDLQWDNAEHTSFSCIAKYEEFNEEHPTGVNANDMYAHIQEIWEKGNAGEYGPIAEYVPPVHPDNPAPAEHQPISQGTQVL
jgi:hypothetical protein